jgi:hypothetical protein
MDKRIQTILENFDFDLMHDFMCKTSWTWFDTTPSAPTVDQLKSQAIKMLEELILDGGRISYIRTGGFKASLIKGSLSLSFVVTEFSADPVDVEEIRERIL